jgi:hypothetical protein
MINNCREIFSTNNFPFLGSLIFEKHNNKCTCSYCRDPIYKSVGNNYHLGGFAGLCLPANKGWTSWRVLFLKFFGSYYYLRWTLDYKQGKVK